MLAMPDLFPGGDRTVTTVSDRNSDCQDKESTRQSDGSDRQVGDRDSHKSEVNGNSIVSQRYSVESDRTSSESDQSTVLSNKNFTSDRYSPPNYILPASDNGDATSDSVYQLRGTDEYAFRVERVRNPFQPDLRGGTNLVYRRDDCDGHDPPHVDGVGHRTVRRYYMTVIVMLYVG